MTRYLALSILPLLLAACGSGGPEVQPPSPPNHGWGDAYDLASEDGTRLRQGVDLLTAVEFEHLVVAPYQEVERCAQVLTGGPLVIVTDSPRGDTPPVYGKTYLQGEPTILVDPTWVPYGPDAVSGLKHEYVHYLLRASGFPTDLNQQHASPLFLRCAGL